MPILPCVCNLVDKPTRVRCSIRPRCILGDRLTARIAGKDVPPIPEEIQTLLEEISETVPAPVELPPDLGKVPPVGGVPPSNGPPEGTPVHGGFRSIT